MVRGNWRWGGKGEVEAGRRTERERERNRGDKRGGEYIHHTQYRITYTNEHQHTRNTAYSIPNKHTTHGGTCTKHKT